MKLKDLLFENVDTLHSALEQSIPENANIKDFAIAVSRFIKNEYGSHNIKPFIETLNSTLKVEEENSSKPEIEIATTFPGSSLYSIRLNGEKQRGEDFFKAIEMIKNITGIEIGPRISFDADKVVDILKDKGYKASSAEMDVT